MQEHKKDLIISLVDEAQIEMTQDASIVRNDELRDHITIINIALDLISRLPTAYSHRNEDELTVFCLMVRCFNSAASCLRLLRCGYYQPAFTMIRDLVETTFLLDLFEREPAKIANWRSLPARKRESLFKPMKVRERLDELDGFREKNRAKAYKLLSTYAAHPTPEGCAVIAPGSMMQIGPFPNEERLTAGLQDLAKYVISAAFIIDRHVANGNNDVLAAERAFLAESASWRSKYMPEITTKKG